MRHQSSTRRALVSALVVVAAVSMAALPDTGPSPQRALEDLLATDRAFANASARTDLVSGLSAMFAPDVAMPFPPGQLASGAALAVEALRANPDNRGSTIEWTPVRGGISADGQHGFTLGFMMWHRADGMSTGLKYLSYWVKRAEGWRVVAYKRARRGDGVVSLSPMAPALPARRVAVSADPAVVAKHRESLDRAERAFSRAAQTMGLGAAFVKYGSADAVNMGGPMDAGFVVGREAIGRLIGDGRPTTSSPVSWAPDTVIVASSGDLGVTIGYIRANAPGPEGRQADGTPFFTVWRRPNSQALWKYVAE